MNYVYFNIAKAKTSENPFFDIISNEENYHFNDL